MKTNHLFTILLVLILTLVLSGCAGMSTKSSSDLSCTTVDINAMLHSGDYQKKVDNFIILQDATPSMDKKVGKSSTSNPSRLTLSKGLVRCLNNSLPENFGVTAGMRIFGYLPSEQGLVYGMSHYANDGLEGGVQAVKGTYSRTDISDALSDSGNDLKQVSGRTAVIIFSDGVQSKEIDPVAAAAAMKEMYGEEVCIYTVLLGDDPNGRATLEEIASQGKCGFATEANNLHMRPLTECETLNIGKGMGDFVASVFLEKTLPPPPPPPSTPPKPDLDSDGDGISDSRDKCPDTPKGIKVDKDGCPIPLAEKVTFTLYVGFDFDMVEVKSQYSKEIEKAVRLLKAYPKTTVTLEGYTDSIGTDKYNMDLSLRRAESVKKDLVENYTIDGSRISTHGFGESNPADTNDTREGRQKNRRVEASIEAVIEN